MSSNITYVEKPRKITVKLEGRIVGELRQVPGGWQYFPKGSKEGGEILPLNALKRVLSEDNPAL